MREISFVKRLKFNFNGSVTKKALVIGDADNDQNNELVCANLQGDLAIFKDNNPDSFAHASDLGMVTACVIGDVINAGRNFVAAINTEGWLYIFDVPIGATDSVGGVLKKKAPPEPQTQNFTITASKEPPKPGKLNRSGSKLSALYDQRMPANCKELLLADLDGDGQNEVIVGLTDRVLRTYKWIKIGPDRGKFVGLYKWEFADQIGAVSLNPSQHENCQDIIVAQPGGTYAKLECFDKKPITATNTTANTTRATTLSNSSSVSVSTPIQASDVDSQLLLQRQQQADQDHHQQQQGSHSIPATLVAPTVSNVMVAATTAPTVAQTATSTTTSATSPTTTATTNDDGDNVRTEYISKLTPEYHQLALGQMRNHHISTEVLGGIRDGKNSDSYSLIVIATLDGTLMLVNKDDILWSLQVDHQLFALAIIETQPATQVKSDQSEPILSQSESTCTIVSNHELLLSGRSRLSSHSSNGSGGSVDGGHLNQTASVLSPTKAVSTPFRQASPLRSFHSKANSGNLSQYFAVCAWNGKTYIIDEERNYLRFKFDEAVSAFTAGNYHFDGKSHASLVYATFNNQIILYYDVILDHIRPMYLLNELLTNPDKDLLKKLETLAKRLGLPGNRQFSSKVTDVKATKEVTAPGVNSAAVGDANADQTAYGSAHATPILSNSLQACIMHELLQDILYNVTDEELYGYLEAA